MNPPGWLFPMTGIFECREQIKNRTIETGGPLPTSPTQSFPVGQTRNTENPSQCREAIQAIISPKGVTFKYPQNYAFHNSRCLTAHAQSPPRSPLLHHVPASAPSPHRLYKPHSLLMRSGILTFLRSPSSKIGSIIQDLLHCTARTGLGLNLLRGLQRGNFCWTAYWRFSLILFAYSERVEEGLCVWWKTG
jgi:hypothetical protein